MSGRRVVLWRHGRTSWNAEGRFQGQTDIDLDAVGVRQARDAALRLAALRPDVLASSDLRRARDTAAALAAVTGLVVREDVALREIHAGCWQGLRGDDIAAGYPEDFARWRGGDTGLRLGGGETRREVAVRAAAAVERVAATLPAGGLAVLATHGGSARLAIARLLGPPLEHWAMLGPLGNAAWSLLEHRDVRGWVLLEHNAGTLPEPVAVEEG